MFNEIYDFKLNFLNFNEIFMVFYNNKNFTTISLIVNLLTFMKFLKVLHLEKLYCIHNYVYSG